MNGAGADCEGVQRLAHGGCVDHTHLGRGITIHSSNAIFLDLARKGKGEGEGEGECSIAELSTVSHYSIRVAGNFARNLMVLIITTITSSSCRNNVHIHVATPYHMANPLPYCQLIQIQSGPN